MFKDELSGHSGQHIKWTLQKCLIQATKKGGEGGNQNKITADLESEMMFSSYQRLIRLTTQVPENIPQHL